MEILRYLPRNYLSHAFGRLVHLRLPRPLARIAVRSFASLCKVDCSEAGHPLDHYSSIGEFFIRDLREGCRPLGDGLVSPVDGTLRNAGAIEAGWIEQVKGKRYTVGKLCADETRAALLEGGTFFNLYLSPRDYHHIHSPIDGSIVGFTYIPGTLWPVNEWSIRTIDGLFTVNERVVVDISTPRGMVMVVMVGATNVGRISLPFDPLITNQLSRSAAVQRRDLPSPITIKKGERIGTFHMGSSVILLCQRGTAGELRVAPPQPVRFGATIAS